MNSERFLERETQFESHCGLGGLNPNQNEYTYPLLAKKQGNSKKQAENKQKVQGVSFIPSFKPSVGPQLWAFELDRAGFEPNRVRTTRLFLLKFAKSDYFRKFMPRFGAGRTQPTFG